MRQLISAFITGLVFGLGLLIAGMANPDKILAFLDLAGPWDPSLVLVMVAAVAIASIGFALARKRTRSVLGAPMHLPTARRIDRRLVLGGLAFGIGWGLSGFCPGPALVATAAGYGKAAVFLSAMLVGMGLYEAIERRRTPREAGATA